MIQNSNLQRICKFNTTKHDKCFASFATAQGNKLKKVLDAGAIMHTEKFLVKVQCVFRTKSVYIIATGVDMPYKNFYTEYVVKQQSLTSYNNIFKAKQR